MSIMSNRAFVLAAALVAGTAGLAATPAFAADEVRTVTIDYKDLNLQTAAGRKTLDRRIAQASGRVCAQDGVGLGVASEVHACRIAAKARAAATLGKAGVPTA